MNGVSLGAFVSRQQRFGEKRHSPERSILVSPSKAGGPGRSPKFADLPGRKAASPWWWHPRLHEHREYLPYALMELLF